VLDSLRQRLYARRRLKFTRQGRWFTAMTLMVGFGAINTGNNLLYLLLGVMLGLIVISGVMSNATLRRLSADRLGAAVVFAGRPARVEYRVRNGKSRVPSYSVEVREVESSQTRSWRTARADALVSAAQAGGEEVGSGRDGAPESRSGDSAQVRDVPGCLVHRVGAGQSQVRAGSVCLPARGLYEYSSLELLTRFPFGFFEKSKRIGKRFQLLALPRVVAAPSLDLADERLVGQHHRPAPGRGLEYLGLRDYRPGEDSRQIHWKVSARRGQLIVREHERERSRVVTLALYNALLPGADARDEAAMERAIEVVAALARSLLATDHAVGLWTVDGTLPAGKGTAQARRLLRALALVEVHRVEGPLGRPGFSAGHPTTLVAARTGAPPLPAGAFARRLRVDARGEVTSQ
jgi:uncharacterized protein (DUF58 family)